MIITKEAFQKLVSAYLDGEISTDEAQSLFDCINSNKEAKAFFLRSCAMHKNLCKLYGREFKFQKIAGVDIERLIESPKRSKIRAISEWGAVACLLIISAGLLSLAISATQVEASEEDDDDVNYIPQHNYQTKILGNIKAEQTEVSIVEIAPKHLILKND